MLTSHVVNRYDNFKVFKVTLQALETTMVHGNTLDSRDHYGPW